MISTMFFTPDISSLFFQNLVSPANLEIDFLCLSWCQRHYANYGNVFICHSQSEGRTILLFQFFSFKTSYVYKVLKHRCWPCAEGKLLTFLIFRSKFVNFRLNCIANGLNCYTDWFMTAFSFLFFQNLVSPTFFFSS